MIKIVAFLNASIGAGGGFDQSLNAIVQMKKLSDKNFLFEVVTTNKENIGYLNTLGVSSSFIKIRFLDRFLSKFATNDLFQIFQTRLKIVGPFEKKLISEKCDVVYYLAPNSLCLGLQTLNYINTVWDLAHREMPEFPEVRDFGTFILREKSYKNILSAALVTLVDSKLLGIKASKYYGVDRERILSMPFTPSPFIAEIKSMAKEVVLKKNKLVRGYFYYPAQFWPHKNHIRILESLVLLRDNHDWRPIVVFSGQNHGNLNHIIDFIKKNQLESQVRILGFVPSEEIRGLYENALAVLMPTYFGPTNLPPLEAWSLGVPLIYSAHLGEQAGDAALLVDADSSDEVASAMLDCKNVVVRQRLIEAGNNRLSIIFRERKEAEAKLLEKIISFNVRRRCWA